MMSKQLSNPNGVLKDEMIGSRQAMQSSSEAQSSTLGMSDTTARPSPDFQPTQNSQESPNANYANLITAFAAKLGKLVEWRSVELGDGRKVLALCFPMETWEVDATNALVERR